jgi:hypothetical protein
MYATEIMLPTLHWSQYLSLLGLGHEIYVRTSAGFASLHNLFLANQSHYRP